MTTGTVEEKAALYDYLIRVGYVSPETCADRIADATAALAAQLQAAQATIENGLSSIGFWLDEGFKRDMAGDTEGRDDAIDIVVQELRKSLSRAAR